MLTTGIDINIAEINPWLKDISRNILWVCAIKTSPPLELNTTGKVDAPHPNNGLLMIDLKAIAQISILIKLLIFEIISWRT